MFFSSTYRITGLDLFAACFSAISTKSFSYTTLMVVPPLEQLKFVNSMQKIFGLL